MLERFDFALWMDSDNVLIEDTCEDMLGNLVALRHGWSFSAGKPPHGLSLLGSEGLVVESS